MLKKFAVTNYRGFKERIEFSLSAPRNFENNGNAIKNGVVKDAMIYGPNGSGKSNIGFALFDIVEHLTTSNKNPKQYNNFTYANNDLLVIFEYYFSFDGQEVEYKYSKDKYGILHSEEFNVADELYFKHGSGELVLNDGIFKVNDSFVEEFTNNANNVSLAAFLLYSYPLSKDNMLFRLSEFVKGMLWFRSLEDRGYIGLEAGSTNLDEFIIKNGLVQDFAAFLEKVSDQHFDFVPPVEGDKILNCMIDGGKLVFNSIASTGTHSLELLYYWLTKISKTSLVFIDEFDAFYHFELAYKVCKILFQKDCQAILTTHNTALMTNDLLRPDCYYLIDGQKIKPLVDCTQKELRLGHNLEKIYRGDGFRL